MGSIQTVTLDTFLKASLQFSILDARSPGEYAHGHIPGAINLPIMNDEERKLVGTCYKQKGHLPAVILGYELVGPKFADHIRMAKKLVREEQVLLHCYRGGLRSKIMAGLLSSAGYDVLFLEGGYKNFRHHVLETLQEKRPVGVVGGFTGSGKTDFLKELKANGEQVIDLERLANHRGSAFGDIGFPPQPTQEQFENILAMEWKKISPDRILWVEDEGRTIGKIALPEVLFELIRNSPVLELNISLEKRIRRIRDDYGNLPRRDLAEATTKLRKRLGDLRLRQALEFLEGNRLDEWIGILLEYYDKTYYHGLRARANQTLVKLPLDEGINESEKNEIISTFKNVILDN